MPPSPPLTVVLPAHDAEATIRQAMLSTLQQTYTDFELWVLENGSSDRTAAVARSVPDPRVTVHELGPVGFQGAIQYAIEHASSMWLARMDADDLMFPRRLQAQMEVIGQHPELVLVGTSFALLTPFGHIFERVRASRSGEVDTGRLSRGRVFADPSTLFSRQVALEVGGVDPEFSMGDLPLLFRLLTRGKGWEIAEPLHLYRIQPESMSRSVDFHLQGIRTRTKYAPETLVDWPAPPKEAPSAWGFIAGLELMAGDGGAVRRATDRFAGEGGPARTARRLRWLSYLGRLGGACYAWRNRHDARYRHRRDWERLFRSLLR
jgi:glycosyltransferase involved in cell wall biosynthesis